MTSKITQSPLAPTDFGTHYLTNHATYGDLVITLILL